MADVYVRYRFGFIIKHNLGLPGKLRSPHYFSFYGRLIPTMHYYAKQEDNMVEKKREPQTNFMLPENIPLRSPGEDLFLCLGKIL